MATKNSNKSEKTATGTTKTASPKSAKDTPEAKKPEAVKSASAKTPSKTKEAAGKPVGADKAPKAKTQKTTVEKPQESKSSSTANAPVSEPESPATQVATGDKWSEIRTILQKMKDETLHEISKSIKNGSEYSVGAEPTGDIYDQASSERDRELGLILSDREREKVHNIDDALMRMEEGEYGICEECDEDIPIGRLKVLPFTRHCVRCKSDLEKIQAQTKRFEEDRAYREIPMGGDDDEG